MSKDKIELSVFQRIASGNAGLRKVDGPHRNDKTEVASTLIDITS